jgi:aminoacrylate hydrolase
LPEAAGLYYELHGALDAPPLILSSGLGGSANYWKPNIAALAEHFHVIAYDHRGTGRSDRAITPRIESIGDDMLVLMDALNLDRVSIIGHAIGGMGALTLALDSPERVEQLIVVNGWGMPNAYTSRCFEARLALLRSVGIRAYVRAQPIFLYPPDWIAEGEIDLDVGEDDHVADFAADMVEQRIGEAMHFDLRNRSNLLKVPTLFLGSYDDGLVPFSSSEWLRSHFPESQLGIMEWGGHACNVTDAATFNRLVLEFLRS